MSGTAQSAIELGNWDLNGNILPPAVQPNVLPTICGQFSCMTLKMFFWNLGYSLSTPKIFVKVN